MACENRDSVDVNGRSTRSDRPGVPLQLQNLLSKTTNKYRIVFIILLSDYCILH